MYVGAEARFGQTVCRLRPVTKGKGRGRDQNADQIEHGQEAGAS
jgi:hypothetical protein